MKKLRIISLTLVVLLQFNCSSSKNTDSGDRLSSDKEKLIEILTLFVEAVQGERFEKALSYLSPAERVKMTDASGLPPIKTQRQLKALRLSTIAQKAGVRLRENKLEGIFNWLPQIENQPKDQPKELDTPLIQ